MSTPSWRKNTSIVEKIVENPYEFTFIQIVRTLERAAFIKKNGLNNQLSLSAKHNSSVGFFAPPSNEVLRFHSKNTLGFPESEVSHIWKRDTHSIKQWQLITEFFGLTGSMGVLPYHYTEFLLQRVKLKDYSLQSFLDLFHHRSVSLFYRASTKYKLHVEYDRAHAQASKKRDNHTQALLSLIGMGTQGLENRQYVHDESLIFFSGLLNQQIRTPSGLENILKHYFDLPVQIHQFIGQWQTLIDDVRTRLPHKLNSKGQNVCLGRNAMLGSRGWFAQGKIRINIGPLNQTQFDQLAPGTNTLKALNELVRIYLGVENDYDFNIQVDRKYIPESIKLGSKQKAIVGWNTWLSRKHHHNLTETSLMNIHLSPNREQ